MAADPQPLKSKVAQIHAEFEAVLPDVQRYARMIHAHIEDCYEREDAIQETIGSIWQRFLKMTQKRMINTTAIPQEVPRQYQEIVERLSTTPAARFHNAGNA
jgi:hypothetical protein